MLETRLSVHSLPFYNLLLGETYKIELIIEPSGVNVPLLPFLGKSYLDKKIGST
jgi:hypothetical protein